MPRIALIALSTMWLATAALAGEPHVPTPEGFVETSFMAPDLKEQAMIGQAAGTRVIGVYLLPDEAVAYIHDTLDRRSIYCQAYVLRELPSDATAEAAFGAMAASMRSSISRPYDVHDPQVAETIEAFRDALKRQGTTVNITGGTELGSVVDKPDAVGVATLIALSVNGETVPVDTTTAIVRQGNNVLALTVGAVFDGQASIDRAANVIRKWVAAVEAAN